MLHIILPLLLSATSVLAHGGVCYYDIDGTQYDGNFFYFLNGNMSDFSTPNTASLPPTPSIQRKWNYYPITNVNSTNMTCNFDGSSTTPSLHAPVLPGSNITSHYNNAWMAANYSAVWPNGWFHGTGPLLTYLAACPGSSCDNYDPVNETVWFKIDQRGLDPSATDLGGKWEQDDLIWTGGGPAPGYTVTIPAGLKAGAYLVRTEVIMLQAIPAQFYIACAQLLVAGGGVSEPGVEDLVAFPGAYSADDPGISIATWSLGDGDSPFPEAAYTTDYPFPGPAVWTGANDS